LKEGPPKWLSIIKEAIPKVLFLKIKEFIDLLKGYLKVL